MRHFTIRQEDRRARETRNPTVYRENSCRNGFFYEPPWIVPNTSSRTLKYVSKQYIVLILAFSYMCTTRCWDLC